MTCFQATKRYNSAPNALQFNTLKGHFYSDTIFAYVKSIQQNKVANFFTNERGYDRFYPLSYKKQAPEAFMSFINNAGILQTIVTDGAKEEHDAK